MSLDAAIHDLILELLNEVKGIREDMKRREHRRLQEREGSEPRPAASGDGPCFPNYGRAKNRPVAGADAGDLDFYAKGCRRTLDDPTKSRWHAKERELLAAIEAEQRRQGGGAGGDGTPMRGGPQPSDAPPDFGGGGDDDIPFVHCGGVR